jgi:hypothetical protein
LLSYNYRIILSFVRTGEPQQKTCFFSPISMDNAMNFNIYQEYLQHYVSQAIRESDGTNRGVSENLWNIQVKGVLVRHKEEKLRALEDARKAFDDHRHWPREIVLSHLGIAPEK